MKTLYAVDANGRQIARLVLAEGADKLDADLYVLRGNVKGARTVSEGPAVPSLTESENRIGAAIAQLCGLPAPKPIEESAYAPGSVEETNARLGEAIGRLTDSALNRPRSGRTPGVPSLPTYTVPKQVPRTGGGSTRESAAPLGSVPLRETERIALPGTYGGRTFHLVTKKGSTK